MNVTKLTHVVRGKAIDPSRRVALFDAEQLGLLLGDLAAGRKLAAAARRNGGRVGPREFGIIQARTDAALRRGAELLEPSPRRVRREVSKVVVKHRNGRREGLDAETVNLLSEASWAYFRMTAQAQKGRVGPIVLSRFEKALAALDERRKSA